MSEIMVRERFLRSGKKVYEYSFEMASVDGKRKVNQNLDLLVKGTQE